MEDTLLLVMVSIPSWSHNGKALKRSPMIWMVPSVVQVLATLEQSLHDARQVMILSTVPNKTRIKPSNVRGNDSFCDTLQFPRTCLGKSNDSRTALDTVQSDHLITRKMLGVTKKSVATALLRHILWVTHDCPSGKLSRSNTFSYNQTATASRTGLSRRPQ